MLSCRGLSVVENEILLKRRVITLKIFVGAEIVQIFILLKFFFSRKFSKFYFRLFYLGLIMPKACNRSNLKTTWKSWSVARAKWFKLKKWICLQISNTFTVTSLNDFWSEIGFRKLNRLVVWSPQKNSCVRSVACSFHSPYVLDDHFSLKSLKN